MKKEILNLKIELFKKTVTNYSVSKKGNHWGYLGDKSVTPTQYQVQSYNVTKSSIDKMFQMIDYNKDNSTILLMTPKGKLFLKNPAQKVFKAITINTVPQDMIKLFLLGRKGEWICNHGNLIRIKFLHSFKSLNEVKLYLGYQFLSDVEFGSLLADSFIAYVIYGKTLSHNDRVNIVHHKYSNILMDAIQMSVQLNEKIVIPESKEKLKIWHDDLVSKKNSEKASQYSDKQIQYESWLFDYWKSKGLEYTILNSQRKLFLQGCKQNHCLASYANQMSRHMYITFTYNSNEYDMQIEQDRGLIQFCGYRNQRVPDELKELCKFDKLQDNYFTIVNPEVTNIPVQQNNWLLQENLF